METVLNQLQVMGRVVSSPMKDHSIAGEQFYKFFLEVSRLSGHVDLIPCTISEQLMMNKEIRQGNVVTLKGQVRAYNRYMPEQNKSQKNITAFIQAILPNEIVSNPNQVKLVGTIASKPIFRVTPFGREITEMWVKVCRPYGKCDYIPCICWGRTARYVSSFEQGTKIEIDGRFQSREFHKNPPADGTLVYRNTYEISCNTVRLVNQPEKDDENTERVVDAVIINREEAQQENE